MPYRIVVLAILLVLIFTDSTYAQFVEPPATDSSCSSPTWIYIGVGSAVVITAVLFHYDQQIYDDLYSWKMNNKIVKDVSPVITNLGDGTFSAGLFAGFAGYGLIFNEKKAFEAGKIGMESFLLTGVSIQLFKHLCGRERPSDATRPGGFWHGPFAYFDKQRRGNHGIAAFDAFPSGHTTTAFAAATTISDFYTEPWVSYTCYSLASLVGVSRVMESTHWLSDCFVGAIIGHYGTRLVEKLNYGSTNITLLPEVDEYHYGFVLSVKF